MKETPREMVVYLFRLSATLHRQARIKAAALGVSLASVLRELLAGWIEEGKKGGRERERDEKDEEPS